MYYRIEQPWGCVVDFQTGCGFDNGSQIGYGRISFCQYRGSRHHRCFTKGGGPCGEAVPGQKEPASPKTARTVRHNADAQKRRMALFIVFCLFGLLHPTLGDQGKGKIRAHWASVNRRVFGVADWEMWSNRNWRQCYPCKPIILNATDT